MKYYSATTISMARVLWVSLLSPSVVNAWNCQKYFYLDNDSETHDSRDQCNENLCRNPSGSLVSYRFRHQDFTVLERAAVEAGVNAWHAGSGQAVQDADWEFRNDGTTLFRSFSDGESSVSFDSGGWFADSKTCLPSEQSSGDCDFADSSADVLGFAITTLRAAPSCSWRATDVVLNEDVGGAVNAWTMDKPSETGTGSEPYSLGMVAMHEFGHALGLGHWNEGHLDVMSGIYPNSGDTSAEWRIQENEAKALVNIKGNGNSNLNLMLSRFIHYDQLEGHDRAVDAWFGGEPSYDVAAGESLEVRTEPLWNVHFDGTLTASMSGNVTHAGVQVMYWAILPEWKNCDDATDDEVLGFYYPNMGNLNTFKIRPTFPFTMPASAPLNTPLKVCAVIDPDESEPETRENDNSISSTHRYYRVLGQL